jgi:exopolyphosphatase/guanosine-5'-triphosphate,3'-diphosphate pyrophosphatase
VRDAENGADFRGKILSATGQPLRVLTGVEEANYIGRGLTCDPALRGLTDFYSFDLGGGSLECLSFRDRTIKQAVSLPLGCVRLTEKCLPKPSEPFPADAERRVTELTKEHLAKSGFKFDLPPEAVAVGTGGTLTTARAILGARRGKTFEASDTLITLGELRELAGYVGRVNLEDRKRLPAMPPVRADVLPTALTTMIALAEFGGFHAYRNSLYNLRWGIAAETLGV